MTILLGCVENINASLEQVIAGKFNASVKKSIFQADEGNYRVYQEVFLRNGQTGSCFGNPSHRLFDLSQLSFWPGCTDKPPQWFQRPFFQPGGIIFYCILPPLFRLSFIWPEIIFRQAFVSSFIAGSSFDFFV